MEAGCLAGAVGVGDVLQPFNLDAVEGFLDGDVGHGGGVGASGGVGAGGERGCGQDEAKGHVEALRAVRNFFMRSTMRDLRGGRWATMG